MKEMMGMWRIRVEMQGITVGIGGLGVRICEIRVVMPKTGVGMRRIGVEMRGIRVGMR